jgi:hypothetical protein
LVGGPHLLIASQDVLDLWRRVLRHRWAFGRI